MKYSIRGLTTLFNILILVSILSCEKQQREEKMLPSAINQEVSDSVMAVFSRGQISNQDEFNACRDRFASQLLSKSKTEADTLSNEELSEYGELLYHAGKVEKARKIFVELAAGEGALARNASRSLISIEIGNNNYNKAEELIRDFMDHFSVIPEMPVNLYTPVQDLAAKYTLTGRPADAVDLIIDEINSLEFDAPYPSFHLMAELIPSAIETGRIDECLALAYGSRIGFEKSLVSHIDTTAYSDTFSIDDDSVVKDFKDLIASYENYINQLNMVGSRAYPFKVLHSYNTDSTFSISDLEGHVSVLDFWTTWCVPCIVGFEEMRDLYDEFKDDGLRVVGITSLQGFFPGMETNKSKDGKKAKLDKEKEIELTSSFIEDHDITWPCIMSKQSIFKMKYSFLIVPTYVVLDRDLNVRFILSGIGSYPQLRRVVKKLVD